MEQSGSLVQVYTSFSAGARTSMQASYPPARCFIPLPPASFPYLCVCKTLNFCTLTVNSYSHKKLSHVCLFNCIHCAHLSLSHEQCDTSAIYLCHY